LPGQALHSSQLAKLSAHCFVLEDDNCNILSMQASSTYVQCKAAKKLCSKIHGGFSSFTDTKKKMLAFRTDPCDPALFDCGVRSLDLAVSFFFFFNISSHTPIHEESVIGNSQCI